MVTSRSAVAGRAKTRNGPMILPFLPQHSRCILAAALALLLCTFGRVFAQEAVEVVTGDGHPVMVEGQPGQPTPEQLKAMAKQAKGGKPAPGQPPNGAKPEGEKKKEGEGEKKE